LLFSNELIEEFITAASRPKFKKYFSNEDIQAADIFR
jgi:predicted nucleic acid-binding protein